jgi:hypothetical protein
MACGNGSCLSQCTARFSSPRPSSRDKAPQETTAVPGQGSFSCGPIPWHVAICTMLVPGPSSNPADEVDPIQANMLFWRALTCVRSGLVP